MLHAVMGPQGSGKTTTLNKIAEQGYPIITRKTSRSILSEWGVTLSQVNNDRELTVRFQEEILKRKIEDEQIEAKSTEHWFTERTYTDLFIYALVALGKDNEYSSWLNEYYEQCVDAQRSYSTIHYIEHVAPIEFDGVRGVNHHYGTMINLLMKKYVGQMSSSFTLVDFVQEQELDARVSWILTEATFLPFT